ncbi:hypothetical protein AMS68_005414 [Peltaster fructicola]|uniref:Uncharacterized protein n=1 Tax=Peltaster fructicola TaxID=286661 RepID=A0A6H0XYS2_9PEZI|nr:hypothetical protein AMS68_005414 [Peltaster fructicola]
MAFTTDFDMSAPTYFIYREAGDLTAPLAFFPAKESDELFYALRAKFPHLKTHSERMRDASIEFLKQELDGQTASPVVSSIDATSPWHRLFSDPSISSTANTSPEIAGLRTPSFEDYSATQCSSSRQNSTPAIADMTGVFSLNSAEQPKQRLRRKMTEAEKIEYRKRRVMKACDKCAKRKRKCTHNQATDHVTSVAAPTNARVAKPSARQTIAQQSHQVQSAQQSGYDAVDNNIVSLDSTDFDDFTLLSDDMMDYDTLFQTDDINSFFHGIDCVDPQWLVQPAIDYASCFSSASLQELLPHVPGNARPQVGLASDTPLIKESEEGADLLHGPHGLQGLQEPQRKNQGIVASGHDERLQEAAGLLQGLQVLQGLQSRKRDIAASGNDVLLQEPAGLLHGLQVVQDIQIENQDLVAQGQDLLLRTARGSYAPPEPQSQVLLLPHELLDTKQVPLTERTLQSQRALHREQAATVQGYATGLISPLFTESSAVGERDEIHHPTVSDKEVSLSVSLDRSDRVVALAGNGNAHATRRQLVEHFYTTADSRSMLRRQDVLSWLQQSAASGTQDEALHPPAALTHTTSLGSAIRADIPLTPRRSCFQRGLSIHTDVSSLSIRKPLSHGTAAISRPNGSGTGSGLATTQAILQEDSRTCTARGYISALENPGLFAASKAYTQAPTSEGFATSHLGRQAARHGANAKRCTSPSSDLFRLRREMSFAKDLTGGCQLSTRSIRTNPMLLEIHPHASSADLYGSSKTPQGSDHEQEPSDCVRPQCTSNKQASIETRSIDSHDEQDSRSKAAPTQRYKEYQTIDRFWVRDHHGRRGLPIMALLLVILLTCSTLPAAMACLLAVCYSALDRSQDQFSSAARVAHRARNIRSFRHAFKLCQS